MVLGLIWVPYAAVICFLKSCVLTFNDSNGLYPKLTGEKPSIQGSGSPVGFFPGAESCGG